jgi:hypothetical protein
MQQWILNTPNNVGQRDAIPAHRIIRTICIIRTIRISLTIQIILTIRISLTIRIIRTTRTTTSALLTALHPTVNVKDTTSFVVAT